MVDVASELRLIDPSELILMIRGEQAANIADLVNSSGELFFRGGALRYALSAGCDVQWDTTPIIRLDMEFHYAAVSAFFKLTIGASAPRSTSSTFWSTAKTGSTRQGRTSGCGRRSPPPACRNASLEQGRTRNPLTSVTGWNFARVTALCSSACRAEDALAVGARRADRRQRRQRQDARLPRGRPATVLGRARQLGDLDGRHQPGAYDAGFGQFAEARTVESDTLKSTLSGNSVHLEDEMMKLSEVNRDYALTNNIKRVIHQMLLSTLK